MVTLKLIVELLNKRVNNVLVFAESSLPESQFRAFRKLVLNEFGESGFQKDLKQSLVGEKER